MLRLDIPIFYGYYFSNYFSFRRSIISKKF